MNSEDEAGKDEVGADSAAESVNGGGFYGSWFGLGTLILGTGALLYGLSKMQTGIDDKEVQDFIERYHPDEVGIQRFKARRAARYSAASRRRNSFPGN